MDPERNENTYSYWKYPRHKWMVLTAAVVQLLLMAANLQNYQRLYTLRDFFGPDELDGRAESTLILALLSGLVAAMCLGELLIGALARGREDALWGKGLLLALIAGAWGVLGLALHLFSLSGWGLIALLMLALMLGCAGYSFWRAMRTQ